MDWLAPWVLIGVTAMWGSVVIWFVKNYKGRG